MKKKSGDQELTGTEVFRKIAKDSGWGLKKGGENGTEQCHEVERVKPKGDETPSDAVKQRDRSARKKEKYPKIDSEDYRTSQFNSCDEINVQPYRARTVT